MFLCFSFCASAQEWEREIDRIDVSPASFNGESSNYCPVFYKTGLLFTSTRVNNQLFQKRDPFTNLPLSVICAVEFVNSSWSKVKPIGGEISRYVHYGPASLNADQSKLYFTRNNDDKKIVSLTNNLGIHIADFKEGEISNIEAFEYNHGRFDFGQPSVSHDGQRLYFVANIPSGYGGADLYVSKFVGGKWTAPTNLGKRINTSGNELYPFTDRNNRLYFSSDGRAGNGGLDLFYTEEFGGRMIEPVPLRSEFNSEADDFGIVIDSTGLHGFFSSNRLWENDTDLIYEFEIHPYWPNFENCTNLSEEQYCYTFFEKALRKQDTLLYVYEWDFGDGIKVKKTKANHCFKEPGNYKVKLNVLDTITQTVALNVAEYELEVEKIEQVYITAPDTVKTGEPFNMYGIETNISGFIPKAYYWNLGSSTRFRGDALGITFENEGEVTVQLGIIGVNKKGKERKYCASKNIGVIK
ncbi:MAG: PKD domain-containing protein [Flavobacteriales bacterium]|nr:PKD domain-containing protein [Flavobacteriales bacterium]